MADLARQAKEVGLKTKASMAWVYARCGRGLMLELYRFLSFAPLALSKFARLWNVIRSLTSSRTLVVSSWQTLADPALAKYVLMHGLLTSRLLTMLSVEAR